MQHKKNAFISELKKPELINQEVKDSFFIRSISDESNDTARYELVLVDKTGTIKGNIWDNNIKDVYLSCQNSVCIVTAKVTRYHGSYCLSVSNMERLEKYQSLDYCPHVDDPKKAYDDFVGMYGEDIKKPHMKALVDHFYKNDSAAKKLMILQGGKAIHHSKIGGYVEHVSGVHVSCRNEAKNLSQTPANFDIEALLVGADLHDIGKYKEYSPLPYNQITDEGYLIGHLNMSLCMVYNAICKLRETMEFPKSDEIKILHLIATSHSAADDILTSQQLVKPMCPEALILSRMDALNSKCDGFAEAIITDQEQGNVTKFNRIYEQYLYKA